MGKQFLYTPVSPIKLPMPSVQGTLKWLQDNVRKDGICPEFSPSAFRCTLPAHHAGPYHRCKGVDGVERYWAEEVPLFNPLVEGPKLPWKS